MGSVTTRKASPADATAERPRKERRDVHHVLGHAGGHGSTRLVRVGHLLVHHAALGALPHGEERR